MMSAKIIIITLVFSLILLCNSVNNPIKPRAVQTSTASLKSKYPRALLRNAELLIATAPSTLPIGLHSQQPLYMKLLPLFPKELLKFFSLSFLMFWIIFVFTMTRDTKDALIVTNCGAESLAFLKVYGVIPAAAGFMMVYSSLAKVLSPRALFYAILIPFFTFYTAFAFILYPLRDLLHPMHWVTPQGGLSYAVNLLRYWTYSLYFIVSELWGSAGVPLLFWSCANDVVLIDQAKRMYPLMSLVGNLGPIVSGLTMAAVSDFVAARVSNDELAFEISLKVLTCIMVGAGVIIAGLHHFVRNLHSQELHEAQALAQARGALDDSFVLSRPSLQTTEKTIDSHGHDKKSRKASLSVWQSLQLLARNSYLLHIATMVLSYGLTIEFTEILWKASVKTAFPEKTEYLAFMGRYSTLVGSSAFAMMFIGANIVKTLGWRAGALTTPLAMGLLAVPFFAIMSFGDLKSPPVLLTAVYVGLVQNVLSKATKYAIFDPCKEMAYIPLDPESKTSGKAAIDVLGARLGKSGGALAQQVLVLLCGSIFSCAPWLSVLFFAALFMWTRAVIAMSPEFERKTRQYKNTSH